MMQFIFDFIFLYAMVNVLGNLPIIAGATAHMKKRERDKVFNIATGTGGLIAAASALFIYLLLKKILGLDTRTYNITVGIWILIVAVFGIIKGNNQLFALKFKSKNIALWPMSIPILAGPGTIASIALVLESEGLLLTGLLVFLVYLSMLPTLQLTPVIKKKSVKIWTLTATRILYAFVCFKVIGVLLNGFPIKF